jgi:hypothetical protein
MGFCSGIVNGDNKLAGLPHDFQAVDGAGHVIDLFNTNASTGATLFQRSVDYLHETVFAGQTPGPLVIQ